MLSILALGAIRVASSVRRKLLLAHALRDEIGLEAGASALQLH